MHIGRLDASYSAAPSTHPLPDEDADDGADCGDDDFADDVVGAEPKQASNQAAHNGTNNADQEIDRELLLAAEDPGRKRAAIRPTARKMIRLIVEAPFSGLTGPWPKG
jgi:hypothetical protein